MKVTTSRFFQLIYPKSLEVDSDKAIFEKKNFPNFWAINRDIIPVKDIASFKLNQGFLWSSIVIETVGGGTYDINGIGNKQAKDIVDELTKIKGSG